MTTNGKYFLLALAAACGLTLTSCEGFGSSGARVVNNPSVDDMARIDHEMGLEPKAKTSTRLYTPETDTGTVQPQRQVQEVQPSQPQLAPVAPTPVQPSIPTLPPNSSLR